MKVKSKHGIKDWAEFKEKLTYLKETSSAGAGMEEKIRYLKEAMSRAGRTAGGAGDIARAHTTRPTTAGYRTPRSRAANPDPHREFEAHPTKGIVRTKAGKVKRKKFGESTEETKWRPTVSQFGKKVTQGNPKGKEGDIARQRSTLAKSGTIETGKFTTPPGKPIRMKKHKPGKEYMKSHPDISYTRDVKGTMTVAHTEYEGPSLSETAAYIAEKKKGGWIQDAEADIERRGTEGKCTPITKPGCTGKAKALAKTFKKMAKKKARGK